MTPEVLNDIGRTIAFGILFVAMIVILIQNSVYLAQLMKSIQTRRREPLRVGSKLDMWARQGRAAIPVSVIAPAFNEELTIVESVRALLSLNYPEFEVIVINDGSPDSTLETLIQNFGLVPSDRKGIAAIAHNPLRGVYTTPDHPNLLVLDKENGRKADAVNAGLNFASMPLICVIDADSLIEADGLLRTTEPFLFDDGDLVAVGGTIRITNGCGIGGGMVNRVGMPKNWLVRIQMLEYLRAFLIARVAASRWSMLMLISGAFGVFKRTAVIEAGGYRHDTVGEDLELVVRLHRHGYETGRPCRVEFVPDALCWTEAPETIAGLRNQRARWQQGALETLSNHRKMIFNRRYGKIGMIGMPLIFVEDVLGPIAELVSYAMLPVLLIMGWAEPALVAGFFCVSLLFGTALGLGAIAHEELQMRRTGSLRDFAILGLCAFVENFGYRQMCAWFRIVGISKFFKNDTKWAAVPRVGFNNSL